MSSKPDSASSSKPPGNVEPKKSQSEKKPEDDLPFFLRGIAKVLHNPIFDHSMGVVIMLNMVVIILETDHAAEHDDTLQWVDFVGWVILVIFVIELLLRLLVFQCSFFYDHWNTFDFVIVVTDTMFSILGLVLGSVFPVSTLRVFRLCKLARVSKVFRVFPELRIMMAGLLGSIRSIFWGSVLLTFVLLVWAIIAVQFIHPLNKELAERGGLDGCERCPRAYSSVMQSTLTFAQQIVAGDSWGTATIPLIEAYPVTAIYFLGCFLSVGFAVMNLILGVVVNVAQTEHGRLKEEIQDEKNMALIEASNDLRAICEDMDADGSGELSMDELMGGFENRFDFRSAVEALDVSKEDITIAFESMDVDRSGAVTYNEFLTKLYKMKAGGNAQFLMEQVKFHILQIKAAVLPLALPPEPEVVEVKAVPEAKAEAVETKALPSEESLAFQAALRCSLEKLEYSIQAHMSTLQEAMRQHLGADVKTPAAVKEKELVENLSLLQITPQEAAAQEEILLNPPKASAAEVVEDGRSRPQSAGSQTKMADRENSAQKSHTIRDVLDAIL